MPIRWRVDYVYEIGAPLISISDRRPWRELPTVGVVRVHLHHGKYAHTLQGFDNYWLDEERLVYGMFNDPHNHAWYDGDQAVAWTWPTPDTQCRISSTEPPPQAHVIAGIMLPDGIARDLGLLAPGHVSPPRPT